MKFKIKRRRVRSYIKTCRKGNIESRIKGLELSTRMLANKILRKKGIQDLLSTKQIGKCKLEWSVAMPKLTPEQESELKKQREDIDYFRKKICEAFRIPASMLNHEPTALEIMDRHYECYMRTGWEHIVKSALKLIVGRPEV